MRLADVTLKYYQKDMDYSCSESMLRGIDEYYHLNMPESIFRSSSAFSGGMYGGHVCGCMSACAMALGYLFSNGHAHQSEKMQDMIRKMNETFIERLGSYDCLVIKPKYHDPEKRCAFIVKTASDIFEEIYVS